MSQRSQAIRSLALHLTDLLCDRTKDWVEVQKYFPVWLALIHMWKDVDNKVK